MEKHPLFLTIDTRGWTPSETGKVQRVILKAGLKPVWLMSWTELQDAGLIDEILKSKEESGAEIGIISGGPGAPGAAIDEQISFLVDAVERLSGTRPLVHRAADWCVDEALYAALAKNGVKVDVTVTPHVSWPSKADYSTYSEKLYMTPQGVLEVPVTVRTVAQHELVLDLRKLPTLPGRLVRWLFPTEIWLEPNGRCRKDLYALADRCRRDGLLAHMTITPRCHLRHSDNLVRRLLSFFSRTEGWWQAVAATELVRDFKQTQQNTV